jgi:hypothetical protein
MLVVPPAMPVTSPVIESTEAIEGSDDDHVPPDGVADNVMVDPSQRLSEPVIEGRLLTVTTAVV